MQALHVSASVHGPWLDALALPVACRRRSAQLSSLPQLMVTADLGPRCQRHQLRVRRVQRAHPRRVSGELEVRRKLGGVWGLLSEHRTGTPRDDTGRGRHVVLECHVRRASRAFARQPLRRFASPKVQSHIVHPDRANRFVRHSHWLRKGPVIQGQSLETEG